MRAAVIVCTRNRAVLLKECLESLRDELAAAQGRARLIVIDNGSTDETPALCAAIAETLPEEQFLAVMEPRTGLSIARNRGIAEAGDADIIAFLDDDAVVLPGWLSACLGAFAAHSDAMGIGGEILPWFTAETTPPPDWFRPPLSSYYCTFSLPGGDETRDFPGRYHPAGVNMAFRRAVFERFRFSEALGRSGTNLISGEETDLCNRVRDAGGRLLYVPPMRVKHFIHPDRLNERWIRERHYFEGVSRARLPMDRKALVLVSGKNLARLGLSLAQRPFRRGSFGRLLADCQILRAKGFLTELLSRRSSARIP